MIAMNLGSRTPSVVYVTVHNPFLNHSLLPPWILLLDTLASCLHMNLTRNGTCHSR